MAISKSDFVFRYTSVEPAIAQTNPNQSLGGYLSTTNIYNYTTLSQLATIYDEDLGLSSVSDFSGLEYVASNFEVMKVAAVGSSPLTVSKRSLNGILNFHQSGDRIYEMV